jgi:hypothetical protein
MGPKLLEAAQKARAFEQSRDAEQAKGSGKSKLRSTNAGAARG